MKLHQILEIANHPDTPKMWFGSPELDDWTYQHRNVHTGVCHTDSGWYVVNHRSLMPGAPDFRVLSAWRVGQRVPESYDIPQTAKS